MTTNIPPIKSPSDLILKEFLKAFFNHTIGYNILKTVSRLWMIDAIDQLEKMRDLYLK